MASNDSSDDEIPSLNSIPPPEEGGVEEVTRVGSHAEIQRALEEAKPAETPAAKPSENIKTPTVPLPAVEIDTIARVDDATGKKKKNAVEELEESALADAAPSTRPPAPPLPPGARRPSTGDPRNAALSAGAGSLPPAAIVQAPAKSNLRVIVAVAIALVVLALFLASR